MVMGRGSMLYDGPRQPDAEFFAFRTAALESSGRAIMCARRSPTGRDDLWRPSAMLAHPSVATPRASPEVSLHAHPPWLTLIVEARYDTPRPSARHDERLPLLRSRYNRALYSRRRSRAGRCAKGWLGSDRTAACPAEAAPAACFAAPTGPCVDLRCGDRPTTRSTRRRRRLATCGSRGLRPSYRAQRGATRECLSSHTTQPAGPRVTDTPPGVPAWPVSRADPHRRQGRAAARGRVRCYFAGGPGRASSERGPDRARAACSNRPRERLRDSIPRKDRLVPRPPSGRVSSLARRIESGRGNDRRRPHSMWREGAAADPAVSLGRRAGPLWPWRVARPAKTPSYEHATPRFVSSRLARRCLGREPHGTARPRQAAPVIGNTADAARSYLTCPLTSCQCFAAEPTAASRPDPDPNAARKL